MFLPPEDGNMEVPRSIAFFVSQGKNVAADIINNLAMEVCI